MLKASEMNDFTRGYIECALWTAELDDVRIDDLSEDVQRRMMMDCITFELSALEPLIKARELGRSDDYNGHDFWLTRNHHGTGFWDRGLGDVGDALTKLAHTFGECSLSRDDDGTIYLEP